MNSRKGNGCVCYADDKVEEKKFLLESNGFFFFSDIRKQCGGEVVQQAWAFLWPFVWLGICFGLDCLDFKLV